MVDVRPRLNRPFLPQSNSKYSWSTARGFLIDIINRIDAHLIVGRSTRTNVTLPLSPLFEAWRYLNLSALFKLVIYCFCLWYFYCWLKSFLAKSSTKRIVAHKLIQYYIMKLSIYYVSINLGRNNGSSFPIIVIFKLK